MIHVEIERLRTPYGTQKGMIRERLKQNVYSKSDCVRAQFNEFVKRTVQRCSTSFVFWLQKCLFWANSTRAQSLELHMIYVIITASMSLESRCLSEYFSVKHKLPSTWNERFLRFRSCCSLNWTVIYWLYLKVVCEQCHVMTRTNVDVCHSTCRVCVSNNLEWKILQ